VALFRRAGLACLGIALAAGVAGCGSSGNSGSGDPLASESVATIIAQAKAYTIAAQSVTISGRPTSSISVDLAIVPNTGCTGTVTQGTAKSQLVLDGNTIYAHTEGMPANQWEKGTAASQASLASLCQLGSILAPPSPSAVTNATRSVTVYAGQPALTLSGSDQATGKPGSVTVTDTAEPVLLNITGAGGSLSFTGYGATKKIDPPSAG
jgi:hypothetical protein